jgi:hypothetical protein
MAGRPRLAVWATVILLAFIAPLAACAQEDCKGPVAPSLSVIVLDPSGQRVCDAVVEATDKTSTQAFTSTATTGDCEYTGLWNTGGTFTVSATAHGLSGQVAGLKVKGIDSCNPTSMAHVTIPLRAS